MIDSIVLFTFNVSYIYFICYINLLFESIINIYISSISSNNYKLWDAVKLTQIDHCHKSQLDYQVSNFVQLKKLQDISTWPEVIHEVLLNVFINR